MSGKSKHVRGVERGTARPAYKITEALTAEGRENFGVSEWVIASGGRKAHITHWHRETERADCGGGAWYVVSLEDEQARIARARIHERDFTAAITAALDLIDTIKAGAK